MSSIIIELQKEALDRNIPVSDLLRKALVISRKLNLSEFQKWIEKETNGYKEKPPDYRFVRGQIKGWNPYNGWVPLLFGDPKFGKALSKRANGQSIIEIEDLVRGNGSSVLYMPFPLEIQQKLSKGFGYETEVALFTARTELIKILESVRIIILNWALKLEEEGILGESLNFSRDEKEIAGKSSQNINNFYGPVNNPQIMQGNEQVINVSANIDIQAIKEIIDHLEKLLSELKLSKELRSELESEITTIKAQASSPKPKGSIIREGLSSIKKILESAGGAAGGQLLIEIGKLIFD